MVSTIFCFLVDEKIKLKVLACSFENNPHQRPHSGDLILKMHTGSRLCFWKIIREAAFDKLILGPFPCSQWEVGTRKTSTNNREGNFEEPHEAFSILVNDFKEAFSILVNDFKEANTKIIGGWKAFERPGKPSEHTQKVLIKIFRPSKIFISWHCPF